MSIEPTPPFPALAAAEPLTRRRALALLASSLVAAVVPSVLRAETARAAPNGRRAPVAVAPVAPTQVTVYKSPSCGCCTAWVEHMDANGFACTPRDLESLDEVKAAFGIPAALQSCHTARVGRYVVEGHVPADLVQRLLKEAPADARGLVVPGMPVGSPGMEGGTPQKYDVLLLDRAGRTRVYARR